MEPARRERAGIPKGGTMAGKKKTPSIRTTKNEGSRGGNPKKTVIPIGRTLKTQDRYLPYKKSKVQELKSHRWVVIIDKNTDEELAVVRLTDENQPNTTYLPTYKKGNGKKTYFKHFVETEDNEGAPIRSDGKKFIENEAKYDLSAGEVKYVRKKVLDHSKQSKVNREKIFRLKNKKPRN